MDRYSDDIDKTSKFSSTLCSQLQLQTNIDSFSNSDCVECNIEDVHSLIHNPNHFTKVLNQNIRGISANFAGLQTLLVRSRTSWDVIILTECRIRDNNNLPTLHGYNSFHTTSNLLQNDGVVMYIKDYIPTHIEEPVFMDANCLVAKIDPNTIIIGIYRSPSYSNKSNFISSLNNLLTRYTSYKTIVLTGDMNVIINREIIKDDVRDYLNLAAYHGLLPTHTFATRVDNCLDHVLLKTKVQAHTFVAQTSLTDHKTVLLFLKSKLNHGGTVSRPLTKIDYEGLALSLYNMDLSPLFNSSDVNFVASFLIASVTEAIKSNSTQVSPSKRKMIIKPWITPGLLKCMRNRDNLHKKAKKYHNNEIIITTYKRYRNFCNNLLRKLKRNYENNELNKAKNNPKLLWKTIDTITNRQKSLTPPNELLKNYSNNLVAVNDINQFFVGVGKNLAENILQKNYSNSVVECSFGDNSNHKSLVLLPTDESEVEKLVIALKSDATGRDGISAKILRSYKAIIVPPLTHICNLALSNGSFPSAFKQALVIPVHKGGLARDRVNSYRPISILPAMSKVLEKIINNRLIKFLEMNNILSTSQYGFRSGRSTGDAVHALTDYIIRNLEGGMKCIAIFLDLAKAFDTVSIEILLKKLENTGVRGAQLGLFSDYLSNRTQATKIGDSVSEDLPVRYGVPQGSVLGPTLFLVYINQLCNLQLTNGTIVTFADDTALLFNAPTWGEVYAHAQSGLDRVTDWLSDNVLTLNADKTKYMAFTKRGCHPQHQWTIVTHCCPRLQRSNGSCDCPRLQNVSTLMYLGVLIDHNLSYNGHIELLSGRLRKLMYVFRSLRGVADSTTTRMVYESLCQSLLIYCVWVWGGTYKTSLLKLERAQRAVLKTSLSLPFRFPTDELYKTCSVLTVRQLFILYTILKQHSLLFFDTAILDKRRKYNVCTTPSFSNFSQRSFSFLGCYLYNKLNKTLNIYAKTKKCVKQTLHKFLSTLSYDETEILLEVIK